MQVICTIYCKLSATYCGLSVQFIATYDGLLWFICMLLFFVLFFQVIGTAFWKLFVWLIASYLCGVLRELCSVYCELSVQFIASYGMVYCDLSVTYCGLCHVYSLLRLIYVAFSGCIYDFLKSHLYGLLRVICVVYSECSVQCVASYSYSLFKL